ncbi:MAG TPA: anthranilate phosphoribosyltransferase [Gemmatimonadaceae bacterium]|nr:anthranilate phosphoribosyltransferase [Gemmatimonadaceae bacterium]
MSADALRAAVRRLAFGESLTADEAGAAFDVVMDGGASASQVAALLMGLRVKGETPSEVAGAARAMRRAMVHLDADRPADLVDTCGTGGGALQTFNISTAAALVAAGAGVRVAKHGNRSFTSQCGSADVLEALGVRIDVPVETMARALRDAGIVFMFAPLMHPAMRHVGPIRRELAVPTVMNIVGPLANPAGAGRQVVGVAERARVPLIAGALAELGVVHSLVVHGEPGLDEISPLGPTQVVEIRDGVAREWYVAPSDYGFGDVDAAGLAGGDPAHNARIVLALLTGDDAPLAARAAVVLNAAAAIYVAGRAASFHEGVALAAASLDDGSAMGALTRLRSAFGA